MLTPFPGTRAHDPISLVRLRERQRFAQGHTASGWQSQELKPRLFSVLEAGSPSPHSMPSRRALLEVRVLSRPL